MIEVMPGKEDILKVVARAGILITNPENWTHGVYARDENGEPVDFDSEDAKRYCLGGALHKGAHLFVEEVFPESRTQVEKLDKMIYRHLLVEAARPPVVEAIKSVSVELELPACWGSVGHFNDFIATRIEGAHNTALEVIRRARGIIREDYA